MHAFTQEDTEHSPDNRGRQADEKGFTEHRSAYLLARRAQRAQEAEFAYSLPEHDLEGVVDDEGRDEHDDGGEDQQNRAENVGELIEVVLFFRDLDGLVDDLCAAGQQGRNALLHLCEVGAVRQLDDDFVIGVGSIEEVLRRGGIEHTDDCAHGVVALPNERHGADEGEVPSTLRADEGVGLADLEVVLLGRVDVEVELGRAVRGATGLLYQLRKILVSGVGDRRAAVGGHLRDVVAVGLEGDDGTHADAAVGRFHALDGADRREQLRVDRLAIRGFAELEFGARGQVDTGLDVVDEFAEGGAQAVGNDEARDGERDAEHNGQHREGESQLAIEQAL